MSKYYFSKCYLLRGLGDHQMETVLRQENISCVYQRWLWLKLFLILVLLIVFPKFLPSTMNVFTDMKWIVIVFIISLGLSEVRSPLLYLLHQGYLLPFNNFMINLKCSSIRDCRSVDVRCILSVQQKIMLNSYLRLWYLVHSI